MQKTNHSIGLRVVKSLAAVLAVIPLALCWYLYYAKLSGVSVSSKGNLLIIALFVVLYYIFTKIYDAFMISEKRIHEVAYSQSLSILLADGIIFCVFWLLMRKFPNVLPGLAALATQIILAILWAILAHKWYYAVFPPKKAVVVFDKSYELDKLIHKYCLEKKFEIQQTLRSEECLQDLHCLESAQTVFISGVQSHERNIILKYCVAKGIPVYTIPRIGDIIMSSAERVHLFYLPMLYIERHTPAPEAEFVKRLFDILVSAVSLLILSPIMLIAAIAIKLTDGGPIFYKQARLTKNGKIFNVLKFRSMRTDAEKDGVARLSTGARDDRITPVGRIIRKVRIDELPQLLNILGGSMSIVGPRPERPEIAAQYEKELPEFNLRLQVKAGLTGYAQVYGKYNTTPYDKLQMDLMYIATASFIEDLRIILATIKILFIPESTDGVEEGQITAIADHNEHEKEMVGAGK